MTFGIVIGHKAKIGIFDEEKDLRKVAELHFSEDDHGTRLIIEFVDKRKPTRIIRL